MGTELCTQEAGSAVVGYEGKTPDEEHRETRWNESFEQVPGRPGMPVYRVWSSLSRHRKFFKVFELGSEQGSCALGPLKRQPGTV